MKTHLYTSLSLLLGLALPLAAQTTTRTTTQTTVITPVTPGPTPTVITDANAAVPNPAKSPSAPITNPNEAPSNNPAVRKSMYQVIDTNGDGLVSRVEFEAYGAALANSGRGASTSASKVGSGANGNAIGSTTNFDVLDGNSDGFLNREEFARSSYHEGAESPAVDTTREPGIIAATTPAAPPPLVPSSVTSSTVVAQNTSVDPLSFPAVDTNSDGYISPSEYERFHTALKNSFEIGSSTAKSTATSFEALDANSDGRLSIDEFARANAKGELQTTVRPAGVSR